jgi:hypothetical protein
VENMMCQHMRQCMAKKWTTTSHVQRRKHDNAGRCQNIERWQMTPSLLRMHTRITSLMMMKSAMMTKFGNDDAKGYFSDGSLPSDEKEEVSDEYFFDHLQDDIAEDYPVEVKGLPTSNAFDAKGNDTNVDPVRNVIGVSKDEQPKQSICKLLALIILFVMFWWQAMMMVPSNALRYLLQMSP